MTITWSSSAVARAGLTDENLLALASELLPDDDEVTRTPASEVLAIPSQPDTPQILFTKPHIDRYVAQHAEMFRTSGAGKAG